MYREDKKKKKKKKRGRFKKEDKKKQKKKKRIDGEHRKLLDVVKVIMKNNIFKVNLQE